MICNFHQHDVPCEFSLEHWEGCSYGDRGCVDVIRVRLLQVRDKMTRFWLCKLVFDIGTVESEEWITLGRYQSLSAIEFDNHPSG